jgi:hypothetical protein
MKQTENLHGVPVTMVALGTARTSTRDAHHGAGGCR